MANAFRWMAKIVNPLGSRSSWYTGSRQDGGNELFHVTVAILIAGSGLC